jgi:hypothetical protein
VKLLRDVPDRLLSKTAAIRVPQAIDAVMHGFDEMWRRRNVVCASELAQQCIAYFSAEFGLLLAPPYAAAASACSPAIIAGKQ